MALKTDPPPVNLPPVTPCEAVRVEIAKYPDWDQNIMQAIAQAENRNCNPLKHNLTMSENHKVCVGSYGVLQVGCLHYKEGEDRNDLATNVRVAHRVWQSSGYTAWTQYRQGVYREFLK